MEPTPTRGTTPGQAGAAKLTLKKMRLQQGLSVKKLAALADVTPQTVGLIEHGEVKPHMRTIRQLTKALGCAFDAIEWPGDPFAR